MFRFFCNSENYCHRNDFKPGGVVFFRFCFNCPPDRHFSSYQHQISGVIHLSDVLTGVLHNWNLFRFFYFSIIILIFRNLCRKVETCSLHENNQSYGGVIKCQYCKTCVYQYYLTFDLEV